MNTTTANTRTVGAVAEVTGVTVRTLHHYDRIGLLVPSHRSASGYRRYTDGDVERLHEILLWRALGFALEQIGRMLDGGRDRLAVLHEQRRRLCARAEQLASTIAAVDAAIDLHGRHTTMTDDEIRSTFHPDDVAAFHTEDYAAEAERRWGDTDAWRQATQRTAGYGPEQWRQIAEEGEQLTARFAALFAGGVASDAPEAIAVARNQRDHLERWWYDCPPQMHAGLADLWADDPRFRASYDRVADGLADYVRDVVQASVA